MKRSLIFNNISTSTTLSWTLAFLCPFYPCGLTNTHTRGCDQPISLGTCCAYATKTRGGKYQLSSSPPKPPPTLSTPPWCWPWWRSASEYWVAAAEHPSGLLNTPDDRFEMNRSLGFHDPASRRASYIYTVARLKHPHLRGRTDIFCPDEMNPL